MKMFRKDEGFTLVELMVVVLIIGILIAIAIPVFNAAKANAQKKSCFANQRTLEGAFQTWIADDNAPVAIASPFATSLVPQYVKVDPKCPLAAAVGYGLTASGTVGTFPTNCTHGHFQ
jgi:prepilin-type N-terminal cleavage/methylation domain-containing protein